jgi:choloylglycine hydrolase
MWRGNGAVLVGRNMDWFQDLGTNLWVLPRGVARTGTEADPNPLTWTAQYGSVVATAYDMATTDGMNERGLGAHLLWLAESDFGARDRQVPAVSATLWAQLFLDQFATVAECVSFMAAQPFQVVQQQDPKSDRWSTVHLALDDATGDSAIIEYLAGQPHVHHDRSYPVMTNSPPFDQQLEHLRNYRGLGGDAPLPGTTEAADRFVRASYYLSRLPEVDSRRYAYAALLSVMRNAAQPVGVPDPTRPNVSMTIWRTLSDLTNLVYAYESSFSPDLVWTRLARVDFDRCGRLDLTADGLVGEVTDQFAAAEPFDVTPARAG